MIRNFIKIKFRHDKSISLTKNFIDVIYSNVYYHVYKKYLHRKLWKIEIFIEFDKINERRFVIIWLNDSNEKIISEYHLTEISNRIRNGVKRDDFFYINILERENQRFRGETAFNKLNLI